MPYKVIKDGRCSADKPFGVVNDSDNELVSCHVTESDADGQVKLLLAGDMSARSDDESLRGPIEYRAAALDGVDFGQRIITVVAAPYEQPAPVEYRGSVWLEVYHRSTFNGAEGAPHRIRANRSHDETRTVGKVLRFYPDHPVSGLVADVKVAKTALGDETLALADEECLSASLAFAVPRGGERLERQSMTRHIDKAYMRHLSFVENAAYTGAQVLSVRHDSLEVDQRSPLITPNLDEAIAEMKDIMQWSSERRAAE